MIQGIQNINLLVVFEHTLIRKSLVRILKEFDRVASVDDVSNANDLFNCISKKLPDVIMLDLEMENSDCIKICKKLVNDLPEAKIIIVHSGHNNFEATYLFQLGAHAFLSKYEGPEELEAAISAIVDEGYYRNEFLRKISLYSSLSKDLLVGRLKHALSLRERSILELICNQCTNKEIGSRLSISENTVRNHKVRIMRKTGVKNTPGLVKYAYEMGFMVNH